MAFTEFTALKVNAPHVVLNTMKFSADRTYLQRERIGRRKEGRKEERVTKSNELMTKHKHEFQRQEKGLNNSLLLNIVTFFSP